jgi:hypothetical protein
MSDENKTYQNNLKYFYSYYLSIYKIKLYKNSYQACNMNAFCSFDLFMVYIPESKQQLRTIK